MKVAELLETRRQNWQQLDTLCVKLENRTKRRIGPAELTRFAALYRAACADLALAESYQLPPQTVRYLHQLVGRAHNQLYPSRQFQIDKWHKELLIDVPQRLTSDPCLWIAFSLFWGVFLLSMYFAAEYKLPGTSRPPVSGYAEHLVGRDLLDQIQEMHSSSVRSGGSPYMVAWYIRHNTGIGLKCFVAGLIFGVGGLFATVFNAAYLGAIFGFMLRAPERDNFFDFVTAHGPFELTAIVLSAAAGMQLGFALVRTGGLSRIDSLRKAGTQAMPTMATAMLLFFFAALIEGLISPTNIPYVLKALVAVLSSGLLVFYFVMLGWPRNLHSGT